MAYVALSEIKARLGVSGNSKDALLTEVLAAAQAAVETTTDRVWEEPSDDSVRLFAPRGSSSVLHIGEATQVSEVEERTGGISGSWSALASTDWELIAEGEYLDSLVRGSGGWACTSRGEPTVRVTGRWASTVTPPKDVREATFLMAMRLSHRKDAPLGMTEGGAEIGSVRISHTDPDVYKLLHRHIRMGVGG